MGRPASARLACRADERVGSVHQDVDPLPGYHLGTLLPAAGPTPPDQATLTFCVIANDPDHTPHALLCPAIATRHLPHSCIHRAVGPRPFRHPDTRAHACQTPHPPGRGSRDSWRGSRDSWRGSRRSLGDGQVLPVAPLRTYSPEIRSDPLVAGGPFRGHSSQGLVRISGSRPRPLRHRDQRFLKASDRDPSTAGQPTLQSPAAGPRHSVRGSVRTKGLTHEETAAWSPVDTWRRSPVGSGR